MDKEILKVIYEMYMDRHIHDKDLLRYLELGIIEYSHYANWYDEKYQLN